MATTGGAGAAFFTTTGTVVVTAVLDRACAIVVVGTGTPLAPRMGSVEVVGATVATEAWP